MTGAIRESVRAGSQAALDRFGVRIAGFNPHMPLPVPRPGVLSTPSMRPTPPTPTAVASAAPAAATAAPAISAAPAGPSLLDRGRAAGSSLGRAARRMIPSPSTLGLMGLGAMGASMLHAREPSDDGRLAYAPLPGSFVQ